MDCTAPASASARALTFTIRFGSRSHDYIALDRGRLQGVRVLTLLIYLTNVTRGGHTKFFTNPAHVVQPRAGRAVLWPSVLDEDPHRQDPRTEHEAQPVLEGTKLAVKLIFVEFFPRPFCSPRKYLWLFLRCAPSDLCIRPRRPIFGFINTISKRRIE